MKISHLNPSFATEITDFNAATANKQQIAQIKDLLYSRKIIALKDQALSKEQYLDFAEKFGTPQQFKLKNYNDDGHPEILVLDNNNAEAKHGAKKLGNLWHSDSSYLTRPLALTFLHAIEVPTNEGDTHFIDTELLLNQLPTETATKLKEHHAVHDVRWSYKVSFEDVGDSIQEIFSRLHDRFPPTTHPAIIRHPITGQKSLFVNPGYTTHIVGVPSEISQQLLSQVFSIALEPDRIFKYRWSRNDVLIWDNRSVWHKASDLPSTAQRLLYRIGVDDGSPFGDIRDMPDGGME